MHWSIILRCLTRRSSRDRLAAILALGFLLPGMAGADPVLRCLWQPPRTARAAPLPGQARIQYTQHFDDALVAALARTLGEDRTLRFRYEEDRPDDYVFPNGVTMRQIHQWLTALLDAWNREPWMPLRLELERGAPATPHVIALDEDNRETGPNSGLGGFTLSFNGSTARFSSRAILNVSAGSLARRELFEAVAKHEIGHCLTLRHSACRSSVMAYATGSIDHGASLQFFSTDDLLGLRSVWARHSPGFGSLSGQLFYEDGSPVGGGDIAAVDEATGEVVATGVTDLEQDGRFRIELPAGRRVRLIAHSLHDDAALLSEHFIPSDMLTAEEFSPTEFRSGDRPAIFTISDGRAQELPPLTVTPLSEEPLRSLDAPVTALLPGERRRVAYRLAGPEGEPVEVSVSQPSLTVANVVRTEDRVEFDVTAAANAAGAAVVQFRCGDSTNVQVGSLWVRPPAGLVRITGVRPTGIPRGAPAEFTVTGLGLEHATGVRLVRETPAGRTELPAELVSEARSGERVARITAPSAAEEGPWEVRLLTGAGEAPRPPEPRPRLWLTRGRLQADAVIDLGDVPVGRPVEVTVELTNRSLAPYRLTSLRGLPVLGEIAGLNLAPIPELGRGESVPLTLTFTPQRLGPTVLSFAWVSDDVVDAATEIRLWAVPAADG